VGARRSETHEAWSTDRADRPRLLVVQTAFLGDVVLTTPLLRALRQLAPQGLITVLVRDGLAPALAGFDAVDEVLSYDKRGRERGQRALWRLARELRRRRFDAAIAAQRSFRTGLLVAASAAPLRVGFAGAAGGFAYTHRVARARERHAVERYLALGRPLGLAAGLAAPSPALAVDPAARRRVAALLAEHGIPAAARLLCVAPGSSWGSKRWLPERFAEVAARARERWALRPVVVGAPDEVALCERVARLAGHGVPSLAGRTGVAELVALIARAHAVVGNDSGAAHVAAALGVGVVSVFGPTASEQGMAPWGPRARVVERADLGCRPCSSHGPRHCPLGHFRCMRGIDSDTVLAALGTLVTAVAPPLSVAAGRR
jgi:heptosyltransferase-2